MNLNTIIGLLGLIIFGIVAVIIINFIEKNRGLIKITLGTIGVLYIIGFILYHNLFG